MTGEMSRNLSGVSRTVQGVLCLCVGLVPWLLDAFNFRTDIIKYVFSKERKHCECSMDLNFT